MESPHTRVRSTAPRELEPWFRVEAALHWVLVETFIERDAGLVLADFESELDEVLQLSSGAQHGKTSFILHVGGGLLSFSLWERSVAHSASCDAGVTEQRHRIAPRAQQGLPGALANLILNHEIVDQLFLRSDHRPRGLFLPVW